MQLLPKIDTTPVTDGRYASLDGLRGVAALVVVFHHVTLLMGPYLLTANGANGVSFGSLLWLVQVSPAVLLHAGGEAVGIFFILSGFVVPLPFLRDSKPGRWLSYYPSRLLRLYLPPLAAIVLAMISIWLLPRPSVYIQHAYWYETSNWLTLPPVSEWFNFDLNNLLPAGASNNPVWSLSLEIWFSILLPLYLLIAKHKKLGLGLAVLAYAVLIAWYQVPGQGGPSNFALFGLGVLLAVHREHVFAITERIFNHFNIWFTGLVVIVVSLGLLWLPHADLHILPSGLMVGICYPLGAGLLVLFAVTSPVLRAAFNHRFSQFLGRISFSLYLVHVPVLTACAYMFGINRQVVPATLLGVVLSVIIAVLFQKFIEAPSHKLARYTGRMVAVRFAARPGSVDVVDHGVTRPNEGG